MRNFALCLLLAILAPIVGAAEPVTITDNAPEPQSVALSTVAVGTPFRLQSGEDCRLVSYNATTAMATVYNIDANAVQSLAGATLVRTKSWAVSINPPIEPGS